MYKMIFNNKLNLYWGNKSFLIKAFMVRMKL